MNLIVNHTGCIIAKLWCVHTSTGVGPLRGIPSCLSHIPFLCFFIPLRCWPYIEMSFISKTSLHAYTSPSGSKQKIPLETIKSLMGLCTNIPHLLKFPIRWASLLVTINYTSLQHIFHKLWSHKVMFLSIHKTHTLLEDMY